MDEQIIRSNGHFGGLFAVRRARGARAKLVALLCGIDNQLIADRRDGFVRELFFKDNVELQALDRLQRFVGVFAGRDDNVSFFNLIAALDMMFSYRLTQ